MLSFLYVYSDHSILECYNLFSGVELSMRSFFVICTIEVWPERVKNNMAECSAANWNKFSTCIDMEEAVKNDFSVQK